MKVMHIVMRERELGSFSLDASQKIVSLHHIGTVITLDMQYKHMLTFAVLFSTQQHFYCVKMFRRLLLNVHLQCNINTCSVQLILQCPFNT